MPDLVTSLPDKTSYEPLAMPAVESNIPPTLLEKAPPEIQWIMNSLSKLTQTVDWLCRNIVEENKRLRETDTYGIQTRLVVLALSDSQKQLKDRVDKLEERYDEDHKEKEAKQNQPSAGKALSVLINRRWFVLLLGILIVFGAFIGASIGLQGLIKLISNFV